MRDFQVSSACNQELASALWDRSEHLNPHSTKAHRPQQTRLQPASNPSHSNTMELPGFIIKTHCNHDVIHEGHFSFPFPFVTGLMQSKLALNSQCGQGYPEFLILLPPLNRCWGYRHGLPCSWFM